jgi:hypothetical protein
MSRHYFCHLFAKTMYFRFITLAPEYAPFLMSWFTTSSGHNIHAYQRHFVGIATKIALGSRVTRGVFEKNRPKYGPISELMLNIYRGKKRPKFWILLPVNFRVTAQSKQSPNRRNFAQSGHPVWKAHPRFFWVPTQRSNLSRGLFNKNYDGLVKSTCKFFFAKKHFK